MRRRKNMKFVFLSYLFGLFCLTLQSKNGVLGKFPFTVGICIMAENWIVLTFAMVKNICNF